MSQEAQPRLILAICCFSVFVAGIDVTIVNVALPDIQRSLHASVSGLQWTIDAYSLVIACLLMLSGSLADRFGRKRIFQTGLTIFTLGSLLCSVAPDVETLVAFRGLQAVGGSMLNPVAMSIVVGVFPERRDRAKAIGVWGSVAGLSLAAGPVVGGVFVDALGWRSIFWVNVPFGIAAILLTQRHIPESKASRARRFDPPGQLLVIALLASLLAAIIEGPRHGWASPAIVGLFTVAVAAGAALVVVELSRDQPLVDVRFFRSPPFAGATVISVAAYAAFGGFLFLNTLYLQDVRGDSPVKAGLMTLPMALMLGLCSNVSGRFVAARGPRPAFTSAGLLLAVGSLMFIRLTPNTSTGYDVIAYLLFGAGEGLAIAPITTTAISGMPADMSGLAGAIASTCRQFGASFGVAVAGVIAGSTATMSFTDATHAAWGFLGACGLIVLVVGLVSTGQWAQSSAARNGERLAAENTLPEVPRVPAGAR